MLRGVAYLSESLPHRVQGLLYTSEGHYIPHQRIAIVSHLQLNNPKKALSAVIH